MQLVFGRLDARTASYATTADLLQRYFPGDYRSLAPGADALERPADAGARVRIAFVEVEERGALRLFLRALRRLAPALPWEAVVYSERGPSSTTPLRADLATRVRWVDDAEDRCSTGADMLVAASDGVTPAPGLIARAIAAGAVPVASRLAVYEETLLDGEAGLLFEPATSRRSSRSSRAW